MGLEKLLEQYSSEESDFLRKINEDDMNEIYELESRGGFLKIGKKMDPKYDFIPSEEEMKRYITESLRRLQGNAK